MTHEELIKRTKADIVAVALTLAEVEEGERVPRSSIYLAMGTDLARERCCVESLVSMGWAEATPDWVRLTKKGRAAIESCK